MYSVRAETDTEEIEQMTHKSIKLRFLPNDETFRENLHELRAIQAVVSHVNVVREGTARSCDFVPRVRQDGWFEYDGFRCSLSEINSVTVYLRI